MESPDFERPFPALTPAQRYHLDVFGYVVVDNTLTPEETGRVLGALQRLKRDFESAPDPTAIRVRGAHMGSYCPDHLHFGHVLETDQAIFDYLTHPRLVAMAEELVGGEVRLEESEAIINRRSSEADESGRGEFGFHTGTRPDYGTYSENGLYHCTFVKTLTNLTDLGPDDGGTVVIAGSHKVNCPQEQIIACAYEDRSLIHQVVAPAGSTLLFGEALIHATGNIHSDRERVIVIGGYTPPMFQAWNNQEPSDEFVEGTPEPFKALISGGKKWRWRRRSRTLDLQPQEWPIRS